MAVAADSLLWTSESYADSINYIPRATTALSRIALMEWFAFSTALAISCQLSMCFGSAATQLFTTSLQLSWVSCSPRSHDGEKLLPVEILQCEYLFCHSS